MDRVGGGHPDDRLPDPLALDLDGRLIAGWRLVQDYVHSPLITGDNLMLQPLTVVFALTVGGQVGGIAGLYLSVPAVAVSRIVWLECLSTRSPVTSYSDRPLMQAKT